MGQNQGLRCSNSKAVVKPSPDVFWIRTTLQPTSFPDCGLMRIILWPTVILRGDYERPPWAFTDTVNACVCARFPAVISALTKTATWSITL